MALCKTTVMKVYNHVIDDVIAGVRDIFTDEGLDEHVLIELRSLWETKLHNSRAVEAANENQDAKVAKKQEGIPIQNSVMFNHGVKREGFNTAKKEAAQHQFLKNDGQTQSNIPAPQPQNPEDKIIPIQITLPIQPSVDAVTRVLTIHVPASALNGQQLHSLLTGPIITATMGLPAPLASSLLQEHVNAALSQQQQQQLTVNKIVMPQMDGSVDIEDTCETNKNAFTTEIPVQLSSCMLQEEQLSENKVDEHAQTSQSSKGSVLPKKARGRASKSKKKEIIFEIIRRPLDGGTDTSDDDDDVSEDDVSDDDIDEEKEDEDAELDEGGPEEEPLNSEDDVTDEEPSDLFDTDNVVVCQYDKITRSRNKWKFYLKDGIMNLDGEDFVFQKANGDAEW